MSGYGLHKGRRHRALAHMIAVILFPDLLHDVSLQGTLNLPAQFSINSATAPFNEQYRNIKGVHVKATGQ